MIMIRRARMPHARECLSGGSKDRIKKRARILGRKMPPDLFKAIDLQGHLIIGQWNNLAERQLESHEGVSGWNRPVSTAN